MHDVLHTVRVGTSGEVPNSLGPFWFAGIRDPLLQRWWRWSLEVRVRADMNDVLFVRLLHLAPISKESVRERLEAAKPTICSPFLSPCPCDTVIIREQEGGQYKWSHDPQQWRPQRVVLADKPRNPSTF